MVRTPTEVQLFRFSAATSNPHRIHFDLPYAQSEGYPGVVVQSHLHASFLAQAVCDWAGSRSRLKRFRWENRALAVAGDTLTITGFVSSVEHHDGVATVSWCWSRHFFARITYHAGMLRMNWRNPTRRHSSEVLAAMRAGRPGVH